MHRIQFHSKFMCRKEQLLPSNNTEGDGVEEGNNEEENEEESVG